MTTETLIVAGVIVLLVAQLNTASLGRPSLAYQEAVKSAE